MVVEAQEEVAIMESRDQSQVVIRGKRTKRQRPLSPVPVPFSTGFVTDMRSSPGSSGEIRTNSCTEEEEETANCLILLARGQFLAPNNNNNNNGNSIVETRKFNSRKFLETDSIKGDGKAGCYVYECKTCNRVFPSFQALGGHRASHKKPRTVNNSCGTDEIKKITNKSFMMEPNEDHHHHLESGRYKNINNSPFSLQLSYSSFNRGSYTTNTGNKGNKVHECGICGAEFNSGQALGGHMRRHRGSTTPAMPMAITESDNNTNQTQDYGLKKGRNFSLDLDLNLPAPEGETLESLDSSSQFFVSKQQELNQQKQQQQKHQQEQEELNQQQTSLVLSAPTLVDCHY